MNESDSIEIQQKLDILKELLENEVRHSTNTINLTINLIANLKLLGVSLG